MAKLTGQTIANSYDQLLIVDGASGISASLQAIEAGDTGGSVSSLKISTSKCEVIPASNSTSLFEVSKADGTAVLSVDTTNGHVGIRTSTPNTDLTVLNSVGGGVSISRHSSDIDNTDSLGGIYFQGTHDGSTFDNGASIKALSAQDDWTVGSKAGTDLLFSTSAIDSTSDSVRMTILDSGNVGIGTSSPDHNLEVAGINAASQLDITTYDSDASYSVLEFRKSDSETEALAQTDDGDALGQIRFKGVDSGSNLDTGAHIYVEQSGSAGTRVPTLMRLETYSSSAQNTNQLVLAANGNVGIGTTSPGAHLTVSDSTAGSTTTGGVLRLQSNDSAGATGNNHRLGVVQFVGEEDADDVMKVGAYIAAHAEATWTDTSSYDHPARLQFFVQSISDSVNGLSAPAMTIGSEGRVGIGTASPDGPMHLYYSNSTDVKTLIENNNADAIGLQIENTNGTGSAGASIHLKSSSADAYIVHEFTSSNVGKLHFHMDNKTSALVIDNDGKVGIGETSPGVELDVAGRIAIGNGTELTISSGAITITQSYHLVDTEGDASADDLVTINGGVVGTILVLKSTNDSRDTTLKDGSGNLRLAGDFILTTGVNAITLLYDGSNWVELSRSDND